MCRGRRPFVSLNLRHSYWENRGSFSHLRLETRANLSHSLEVSSFSWREGKGREGGREKEGGREGGRKGGREEGREGGREGHWHKTKCFLTVVEWLLLISWEFREHCGIQSTKNGHYLQLMSPDSKKQGNVLLTQSM